VVSAYTERWQMALGATFILLMIFAPEGIIGTFRALLTRKARQPAVSTKGH
jgi:branched-chain amino acid transport system permease protein